ncbi:MAG TPA: hypothetical protein VLH59_03215 [Ignavibacteriaceae bacterium]|nr:hypothetical protein [Ignavibacteriaceae bacterium]
MIIKIIEYLFVLLLFFAANAFPQSERYTKGAENGYTWISMEDPTQPYNTSKENYLGSILDRYHLTQEKYPEIASLSCSDDMNKLLEEGKSEEISLEDIVNEINIFYSGSENMIIPIIFAYCYTIKKLAGASAKELNVYKKEVLKFCN